MGEWHDFFVAQAGASAALAGLIFVAISISLDELVKYPHLLTRAAVALCLLVSVLVISSLLLAPNQSPRTAGIEILGVSAVTWLMTTLLSAGAIRSAPAPYRRFSQIALALVQIATIPLLLAGIVVIAEGTVGLGWLVAGFVASFIVALADGWVLLVETHR